jgi:hypothetical protein
MSLIKKQILLVLFLTILTGCGGGGDGGSNFAGSSTSPVIFTENLNKSLPDAWVTEYNTIKTNLLSFLPLYQTFYKKIFVYAWQSDTPDPYPGVSGGSYISGGGLDEENSIRFVMEITSDEFVNSSLHRYSVIVHEYFHTYQMSLNSHMNKADDHATSFKTKWLVEGAALAVEGIYIKQNYGYDYIATDTNDVSSKVFTTPELYEDYTSSADDDNNYSSSVFLVLVLAKELQILGHTEIEAFRLIFRDYMAASPNKLTWKTKFDETFGMTVDDFYVKVKTYIGNTNADVVPTADLSLERIFSS